MKSFIIKNARLADETNIDILVEDGIIKEVGNNINNDTMRTISLGENKYISPGWIDAHTHCFEKFKMYGDNADIVGYLSGVTTVVDAGTAGAEIIDEFYQVASKCKTNVYAFINICKKGIFKQNELEDLNNLDISLLQEAYQKYADFIVGIKVRSSKSVVGKSGDQPLMIALDAANQTKLPLMVHIGTAPSQLESIIEVIRKEDIITHIFNPKENGIVTNNNKIKECVYQAIDKGIYFDVGHGTDSFSFRVLDIANENDIQVDTISSDIYSRNRKDGPVYDLATTMTKFLYRGYDLPSIIDRVTKNAADMLHLDHIGRIEVGKQADFTIFKVVEGEKGLIDSTGQKETVHQSIVPVGVILKGECIPL